MDTANQFSISPWPHYEDDEIESVMSVLKTGKVNYWTGELTKKFESEFASYHGMKFGIAVSNGTLALELALIGLGIGPGDEVLTTCRTFIASASCVVRVGAIPILCDVDLDSQNIDVTEIEKKITKKTKAILPVHLGGWPCDMKKIIALAKKHGLKVIEDCAQAHGARVENQMVGSFSDVSAFSFCQDKIISTGGEGGMVLTNDESVFKKMWAFKDHGKSYDIVYQPNHKPGFLWLHESFGSNFRFTEIQSAIGLKQLSKLEGWVQRRREIALQLIEGFKACKGFRVPVPGPEFKHSYYRLYVFARPDLLKKYSQDQIIHRFVDQGIPCFVGSCGEIYREKAFTNSGLGPKEAFKNAAELFESSLAFLVHPTLKDNYAKAVIDIAKTF